MAEKSQPEKHPGPFAQDRDREPPTKGQREKDYGPEKRDTGEAIKGVGNPPKDPRRRA
jgi:hypothetical protein